MSDFEQKMSGKQWPESAEDFFSKTENVLIKYGQREIFWDPLVSLAVDIMEYGNMNVAYSYLKLIEEYTVRYRAPIRVRNELREKILQLTRYLEP